MERSRAKIAAERDVPFERFHERIARVAIPLEFFSVPVNVYVLLGDHPTAIDCGPQNGTARERIENGLAQVGLSIEELRSVVVTHHHVDHLGFLPEILKRSRALAYVHEDEASNCEDVRESLERRTPGYRELAKAWGYPDELTEQIAADFLRWSELGGRVPEGHLRTLQGASAPLPVPGLELRAIHVPGHSEGQVVLHDEAANVLFSADHVLERVTPNPAVYVPAYRGRTAGLVDYLASLEKLESLPRDVLVCPGHGAPFRGLHARLESIREHHAQRRERVLALLDDKGQTVLELAKRMWPGLDRANVVLASREVLGQLDLLESSGRAARDASQPAHLWKRAA